MMDKQKAERQAAYGVRRFLPTDRPVYINMRKRHEIETNRYLSAHAFFAQSEEQFVKGIEKLGVSKQQADAGALVKIGDDCFMLASQLNDFEQIKRAQAIGKHSALDDADFAYELVAFEGDECGFAHTGDLEEFLKQTVAQVLDMSAEDVMRDPRIIEAALDYLQVVEERCLKEEYCERAISDLAYGLPDRLDCDEVAPQLDELVSLISNDEKLQAGFDDMVEMVAGAIVHEEYGPSVKEDAVGCVHCFLTDEYVTKAKEYGVYERLSYEVLGTLEDSVRTKVFACESDYRADMNRSAYRRERAERLAGRNLRNQAADKRNPKTLDERTKTATKNSGHQQLTEAVSRNPMTR
jgi:hypothetical protein